MYRTKCKEAGCGGHLFVVQANGRTFGIPRELYEDGFEVPAGLPNRSEGTYDEVVECNTCGCREPLADVILSDSAVCPTMTLRMLLNRLLREPDEILDGPAYVYGGGANGYTIVEEVVPIVVEHFNEFAKTVDWDARAVEGQLAIVIQD